MIGRMDPGACPICGAAHTACTAGTGAITSVMTPALDQMAAVPLVSETVPLAPGQFSTATYRGKPKR